MSLVDMLQESRQTGGNRIAGVVIGIVTNNQDPDNLGKVKVKFPWRDSSDESHWARVAAAMAGNDRGAYFLPEVGDEVLVAFEHGDISHPFILGALWNGQDKPPENNSSGNNNVRKIKSRSGHELIFDDTGNSEKIEIHTKAGHKILLDDSSGGEKIEVVDKSGNNSIKMDSSQNSISIESAGQIKIKSQMIEIQSDTTMKIQAGATLTMKGAMVQIN